MIHNEGRSVQPLSVRPIRTRKRPSNPLTDPLFPITILWFFALFCALLTCFNLLIAYALGISPEKERFTVYAYVGSLVLFVAYSIHLKIKHRKYEYERPYETWLILLMLVKSLMLWFKRKIVILSIILTEKYINPKKNG